MPNTQLAAEVERDVADYIRKLRAIDPNGRDTAYKALYKKVYAEVYEMRRAEQRERQQTISRRAAAAT
jgi:hypothetical protein